MKLDDARAGGSCRTRARRFTAAVPLIVAACAASGCGSSGPSHKDFVAQANQVCSKSNAKQQQIHRPTTLAELGPFLDSFQQLGNNLVNDLSKVKVPSADKAAFDKYLSDLRSGLATLPSLKADAQAKDVKKLQAGLAQLQKNPSDLDASKLGLTQCARPTSPQA